MVALNGNLPHGEVSVSDGHMSLDVIGAFEFTKRSEEAHGGFVVNFGVAGLCGLFDASLLRPRSAAPLNQSDPETQLYYVRNRTYSPTLGRWLQRDPISGAPSLVFQTLFSSIAATARSATGWGGVGKGSQRPSLLSGIGESIRMLLGTLEANLYLYAESNPMVLVDPTGWRVLKKQCLDAIANLNRALANAENDMRKNIEHFPPDAGHVKEKEGRIADLADAMGRVVKYCGCDVAAGLLARAKAVLDKLEELISAFSRAMANHQLVTAMLLLLTIIPLLAELTAMVTAIALAAG